MRRGGLDLAGVTAALDTLVEQGGDVLGPDHLRAATELRDRVHERVRHGDALTVVAVAGGTGAGKSALVNRLANADVATEGVRRPTTDHAVAVASELGDSGRALLDHLDIQDRRIAPDVLPSELVLVDLPDHDSVMVEHHATSARLAARVDALVVVVDPVKYARADLHHGPLAELTRHADVVTVVLNRTDEVGAEEVEQVRADLAAKLAVDGLGEVDILTTSAATGAGIELLRAHLHDLAAARSAAVRRLVADAAQLADRIAGDAGDPAELTADVGALLEPLLDATDSGRTATAAAVAYRRAGREGCRSPLARMVGVAGRIARQLKGAFVPADPPVPPPQRSIAAIEAVLARHVRLTGATGREHAGLAAAVERIADDAAPAVIDAVEGVPLQPRHRAWWTLVASLRGLLEAAAVVGLAWLLLIGLGDWLQLPDVPAPDAMQGLSWPVVLLLYGLVGRVLLGIVSRVLIALGARRHARRAAREVRRRLGSALDEHVLSPVEQEMRRRRAVREQVAVLRRG